MVRIYEGVMHVGTAPVASPDEFVGFGELAEQTEVAFPRRLPPVDKDNVGGKSEMMNANRLELGGSLVEEVELSLGAPVGFVDLELDSVGFGITKDRLDFCPKRGL
jgi:hypothetical protein